MKKSHIDRYPEEISLGLPPEKINKILFELLKEKYTDKEIKNLILKKTDILLPVSIFRNKLSTLEIIVKYLKENLKLKNHDIAKLLNRTEKTVWSAYKRALKKNIQLEITESKITVPIKIFYDRRFSSLESLVAYLKSNMVSFSQIADLLSLSYKTVYTVYSRYKMKKQAKVAK